MSAFLLDTSAVLCHHYEERGWQRVHAILMGEDDLLIAAPSLLELRIAIQTAGGEDPEGTVTDYLEAIGSVVDITATVAKRGWAIRAASPKRIPTIDCLIAACAAEARATLVHRDPHFSSIPAHQLKQISLDRR